MIEHSVCWFMETFASLSSGNGSTGNRFSRSAWFFDVGIRVSSFDVKKRVPAAGGKLSALVSSSNFSACPKRSFSEILVRVIEIRPGYLGFEMLRL